MQQADGAHSATRTIASPGNIEFHSTTRRGILTAFTTLPAIALVGSAAVIAGTPASAFTTSVMSPVMAALAANRAAEDRFCNLDHELERESPLEFEREERRMHDAWDALKDAEPLNWSEFIAQLVAVTNDGAFGVDEGDMVALLRRARRLERGA